MRLIGISGKRLGHSGTVYPERLLFDKAKKDKTIFWLRVQWHFFSVCRRRPDDFGPA
jgi:hypothetical protein